MSLCPLGEFRKEYRNKKKVKKELKKITGQKIKSKQIKSKQVKTVMKKICSKWKNIHASGRKDDSMEKKAGKIFNDLNETRRAITKLCPKGFFEWPAYYTREKLEEILKRTVPLRNWNMMFVMQNICANWKEIFDIK